MLDPFEEISILDQLIVIKTVTIVIMIKQSSKLCVKVSEIINFVIYIEKKFTFKKKDLYDSRNFVQ